MTRGWPATGGPVPSAIAGWRVIVPGAPDGRPRVIRPLVVAPASSGGSTHCNVPPDTVHVHVGLSTALKVTPVGSGIVIVGWPAGPAGAGSAADRPGPSD